ncbi:MAG TPA: nuclear transport factor 2 family protein, partial [Pyrinomonadaceae bacterium]
MKRIILFAALLLAASACKTAEAPGNANATPQPANANAASTPKAEASTTESGAITQEKQIWDNIKKKDPEAFAAMLAEDFIYLSSDGVYNKAATVNGIKMIEPTEITLSDWKTVTVNKDATVVIYTVDMKGKSGGEPIPPGAMRAGSLWVNRGGKWVGVFHQDTAIESPPAGGDSGNSASSNTATAKPPVQGDETKTAEPVSDDAVAREKQVWDAIKKKDYDRFASFLAEDQMEVFGWGVNDKAASVEGV